jgi:hypothetical protein
MNDVTNRRRSHRGGWNTKLRGTAGTYSIPHTLKKREQRHTLPIMLAHRNIITLDLSQTYIATWRGLLTLYVDHSCGVGELAHVFRAR